MSSSRMVPPPLTKKTIGLFQKKWPILGYAKTLFQCVEDAETHVAVCLRPDRVLSETPPESLSETELGGKNEGIALSNKRITMLVTTNNER